MSTTKHRGSAPSSHTEGLCVSVTVLEETGTTLRDRSGLVLISGGEEGGREGGGNICAGKFDRKGEPV